MAGLQRTYRYGKGEGWTNKQYDLPFFQNRTPIGQSYIDDLQDEWYDFMDEERLRTCSDYEYKKTTGHYRHCSINDGRNDCSCAMSLSTLIYILSHLNSI